MRFLLPAFVMLVMAVPARAGTETLSQLVERFIVPHYQALALTADAQEKAWSEFCAKPDPLGFKGLQRAYLATADSWSQIEFLRYGPIGEEFRAERLSYWPERKNATAKGLAQLLAKDGVADLAPELFFKYSVAAQGLPALERLLFDENAQDQMLSGARRERRCAVGQAIAWNIVTIAHDVRLGWTNDVAESIASPDAAQEATSRIATDFLAIFAYMRDSKLRAVLGKTPAEARPQLAEGWRSKRSKRALELNLETALDVAKIIMKDKEGNTPLTISTALSFAEALPEDFGAAVVDIKQRQQFYLVLDALAAARDKAHDEIPAVLGVTVGFNSQDGD
ncbi:imelysin family protein [Taklimakanibacter lacteus]|uniref:imelysin family protein n=1 Tax=Taklimakanibacter lacteus TaxID=2268456 RepID=UPI0013C432C2